MAFTLSEIAVAILAVATTTVAWRVLNWVWFRPKKFEKHLKKQGFHGNSYRFLYGDTKEHMSMLMATRSEPIPISHDVPSRTTPFLCKLVREYGTQITLIHQPDWSVFHSNLNESNLLVFLVWRFLFDVARGYSYVLSNSG